MLIPPAIRTLDDLAGFASVDAELDDPGAAWCARSVPR